MQIYHCGSPGLELAIAWRGFSKPPCRLSSRHLTIVEQINLKILDWRGAPRLLKICLDVISMDGGADPWSAAGPPAGFFGPRQILALEAARPARGRLRTKGSAPTRIFILSCADAILPALRRSVG